MLADEGESVLNNLNLVFFLSLCYFFSKCTVTQSYVVYCKIALTNIFCVISNKLVWTSQKQRVLQSDTDRLADKV